MHTNNPSLIDLIRKEMGVRIDLFDFRKKDLILPLLPPLVLAASDEGIAQHFKWNDYKVSITQHEQDLKVATTAGTPYEVFRFLETLPSQASFCFSPLGNLHFQKDPGFVLENGPVGKLQAWINYALSPELWGPQGKWMRFHQRLHTFFDQNHLLKGEDFPGFYPVNAEAFDWQKIQLKGDLQGDTLELTLPWSFPLSALIELEQKLKGP